MIQIKRLKFIPNLKYSTYSMRELLKARDSIKQFEKISKEIWAVSFDGKPMIVFGVCKSEGMDPPHVWFLFCQCFLEDNIAWHMRMLKGLLPQLEEHYPKLRTLVETRWDVGLRFARFAGFRATGLQENIMGVNYLVMER